MRSAWLAGRVGYTFSHLSHALLWLLPPFNAVWRWYATVQVSSCAAQQDVLQGSAGAAGARLAGLASAVVLNVSVEP